MPPHPTRSQKSCADDNKGGCVDFCCETDNCEWLVVGLAASWSGSTIRCWPASWWRGSKPFLFPDAVALRTLSGKQTATVYRYALRYMRPK